jgi:hypothetical protein
MAPPAGRPEPWRPERAPRRAKPPGGTRVSTAPARAGAALRFRARAQGGEAGAREGGPWGQLASWDTGERRREKRRGRTSAPWAAAAPSRPLLHSRLQSLSQDGTGTGADVIPGALTATSGSQRSWPPAGRQVLSLQPQDRSPAGSGERSPAGSAASSSLHRGLGPTKTSASEGPAACGKVGGVPCPCPQLSGTVTPWGRRRLQLLQPQSRQALRAGPGRWGLCSRPGPATSLSSAPLLSTTRGAADH